MATRGVILGYHRVCESGQDPQCLALSARLFSEQMEVLSRTGVPMSLPSMLIAAQQDALPPGATAVTFDDGYADLQEVALPILRQHGVPVTVFVSTANLATDHAFWWDELERHCLWPGTLPRQVRLSVGGHVRCWDLGSDAAWTATVASRHRTWTVLEPPPTARHRLYLDLCAERRRLAAGAGEDLLCQLAALTGAGRTSPPSHRPLRAGDLAALASDPLVTIGSHTHSHPALASLASEAQRGEILEGRRRLETLLGRSVPWLAYPFGSRADVSNDTRDAARQSAKLAAVTTQPGAVTSSTDTLALPRVVVGRWPTDRFAGVWRRWAQA